MGRLRALDWMDPTVSPCPWVRIHQAQRNPTIPSNLRVKGLQDHHLDNGSTRLRLDHWLLLRELPYQFLQSGKHAVTDITSRLPAYIYELEIYRWRVFPLRR